MKGLSTIAAAVLVLAAVASVQHWRLNRIEPGAFGRQLESVLSWQSEPVSAVGQSDARIDEPSAAIVPAAPDDALPLDSTPGQAVQDERVDDLVYRAQSHLDLFERFEAIANLGDSRGVTAERGLVRLLDDPDRDIREAVVESLAEIASPGAIDGLRYALRDEDELIRMTAIELLAEIGTPDAIYALAATVDEPDPFVRLTAVSELGELESVAAHSVLQQFLSDSDSSLRDVAAEYLTTAATAD